MEIDMNMQNDDFMQCYHQCNQIGYRQSMIDSLTAPPPSYTSAPLPMQKPSTQMPTLTQENRQNAQYGSNAKNTDQSAIASVPYATSMPLNNKDEL